MEWSCPWQLTTSGGTIQFNTGSGDEFVLDPSRCDGDMPEVRSTVDPSPRTSGAIVHAGYLGKWTFTLGGVMHCRTGTATARNTMHTNLLAALRSIVSTTGTLQQTPSGGAARTVSVQLEVRLGTSPWASSGGGAFVKQFVFVVVSGATDWT